MGRAAHYFCIRQAMTAAVIRSGAVAQPLSQDTQRDDSARLMDDCYRPQ